MSLTTSPNLGPLTTYWTPPSTCLSTVTSCSDWAGSLWLGMTANAVDLNCYPPNFATDDVYSPGICPKGWTSACSPSAGSGTANLFLPGTIAVQCCPSSMICASWGFAWCSSIITAHRLSALMVATTASTAVTLRPTGTVSGNWDYDDFQGQTVLAKPIFVAYQSTDTEILNLLSTTSSLMGSPTSLTSSPPPSNSTSSKHSPSKSLSKASKIAIGVSIPVVILSLVIAVVVFWIRRRRHSHTERPDNPSGMDMLQLKAELHAESAPRPRAELEGSQPSSGSNRVIVRSENTE